MKTISVMIPCYNEEENIMPMTEAVTNIIKSYLSEYEYEIIFIDNDSTDSTQNLLREVCKNDKHVKAIFNAKNFGQLRSPYYGLLQTSGDCVIYLCCDFQDPVELIPEMVKEWEDGNKIIVMQKQSSEERHFMFFLRSIYYKIVKRFSDVMQIEHFTGFGLYDREFIDVLRKLDDPIPFFRGIVAELGYKIKIIPYKQPNRKAGKSKNNLISLYDIAMISITSYTKVGLRMATFLGFGIGIISFIIGMVYLIEKIFFWDVFMPGSAAILVGLFFLGAIILVVLGIMGEYILTISQRVMHRPLVIEAERINFSEEK